MNYPKSVEIDGKKFVAEDSIDIKGDLKIVVLQRGHVLIGYLERDGSECKLHKASVIRKWGTTKGLGQLANEGKQNDTILDKCYGEVDFDYLTVVFTLSCKEELWKNAL